MTVRLALWTVAAALVVSVFAPGDSSAADHRDGPFITDRNNSPAGSLDLNDLYVFVSPTNRNNTVIIQTMSPGAGVVGPGTFFPGAAYELRVSNDGNLETDEFVIETVFSQPNSAGRQTFVMTLINAAGQRQLFAQGSTNGREVNIRGGGKGPAGIFDDPFFFDVNATARFNREITLKALGMPTGFPDNLSPARHLLAPNFPQNFFGGANTLAIVIEIPRTRLQSSRNNTDVSMWIRSLADIGDGRGFAQFDRTAVPGINTVVVPLSRTINGEVLASGLQDQFNRLTTKDDAGLRPVAVQRLTAVLGLPASTANAIADAFLPDVAKFDTTDRSGFPNGRRLADDVIDIELKLLSNNALGGDRIPNDSYFRRNFPYIGRPNPVTQVLRASAAGVSQRKALDDEIDPRGK